MLILSYRPFVLYMEGQVMRDSLLNDHTHPPVQLLEHSISALVEHAFKEHCPHYDGDSEGGRPPEQQAVDGLYQRHVEMRVEETAEAPQVQFRWLIFDA